MANKKKTEPTNPLEFWISASKMECAEACQLHFWLRYVAKVKVLSYTHPSAAIGSIFHRAVELWYQNALIKNDEAELTPDNLLAQIDAAFDWCIKEKKFILPDGYLKKNTVSMKQKTRDLLEFFYEDMVGLDLLRLPVAIERSFNIKWVTDILGIGVVTIVLNGFIDRIMKTRAGEFFITDYKTSSMLPSQKDVDDHIQLTIYQAAFMRLAADKLPGEWPAQAAWAELYFPKFRRPLFQSPRTDYHFDDLKRRLVDVVRLQVFGHRQAQPSADACRFCEFADTEHCSWAFKD
jgi:RecB family exonuclease